MKLVAKRLTGPKVGAIMDQYCTAIGAEQVLDSFGWPATPTGLAKGERQWVFRDHDLTDNRWAYVGWGSSTMSDALAGETILSCGVWPWAQRKGYWHAITAWMCDEARHRGVERATRVVRMSNEEHFARSMREEDGWVHSGVVWFPREYGYFTKMLRQQREEPS